MNTSDVSFNFDLANEIAVCTVKSVDEKFLVYFDGEYFGTLVEDEIPKWIQIAGKPIPETIIKEVGEAIEEYYS